MGQMRTYEVTTVSSEGVTGTAVVRVHKPAEFLKHATMSEGERAKPGKVYSLGNGATITYKTITLAQYNERREAERAAGERDADTDLALSYQDYELGQGYPITPVNLDPEPGAMSEHSEAEQVVAKATAAEHRLEVEKQINLRLSVSDSYLTGETIFDDDVITSLGFDCFLNGAQYDAFVIKANEAGYAVSTPCESMTRFLMAQPVTLENVTIKTTVDVLTEALDAVSNPEPRNYGVINYVEWNHELAYEAEDWTPGADTADVAAYFETNAEARDWLRNERFIDNITDNSTNFARGIDPEPLPEGARVSVTVPATVALYTVPKLSKRQQRRQAGALFCVQRTRR
jgi:hypothetical protein